MPSATAKVSHLRNALDKDGFVVIKNALTNDEMSQLRQACQRSVALARAGDWPHVRTLPKQFPPWNNDISNGIWGVQHLLHPSLPDHRVFAESYFAPYVISAVAEILNCKTDDLVMELYNLLTRPDQDFALRWHRDVIPPTATAEEEQELLVQPILHAQWNLALYDDQSLVVVPGSHIRPRTKAERYADPFEDNMTDQKTVTMRAGDLVFYNNNILHRGVYTAQSERMTLHGSMGVVGADPERARNILQHGIGDWVHKCDFGDLDGKVCGTAKAQIAEDMKNRLTAMGSGEDTGFCQDDP